MTYLVTYEKLNNYPFFNLIDRLFYNKSGNNSREQKQKKKIKKIPFLPPLKRNFGISKLISRSNLNNISNQMMNGGIT